MHKKYAESTTWQTQAQQTTTDGHNAVSNFTLVKVNCTMLNLQAVDTHLSIAVESLSHVQLLRLCCKLYSVI